MQRRIFVLFLLITSMMSILLMRLGWIQLNHAHSSWVEASVHQRQQTIVLDRGRGDFYDRNGVPLTGRTYKVAAVFPNRELKNMSHKRWGQLCAILKGVNVENCPPLPLKNPILWKHDAKDKEPQHLSPDQEKKVLALQIPGVTVVPYRSRYLNPLIASQLIGYSGQNPKRLQALYSDEVKKGLKPMDSRIGASGLEKTFEPFLTGREVTSVSYFTNAAGISMKGLGIRKQIPENRFYPLHIITTIDAETQLRIQQAMTRLDIVHGAVVVLDVHNGDIIAMASKPDYNPNDVKPKAGNWENAALKQTVPGSIFKTVVAAAALEAGTVTTQTVFSCNGKLGQYGFACWKKSGHGEIGLKEAYAESCNIVFAQIMRTIPSQQLIQTAKALGAYGKTGYTEDIAHISDWQQLDNEDSGQLFAEGTIPDDDGVRVQTAIGQRDVRMTPLQAASMVMTIVNGGKRMQSRIVSKITYANGGTYAEFPSHGLQTNTRQIHEATAHFLREAMSSVVEEGTGQALRHDAVWKLAGKTGTAETVIANKPVQNQWFVGYGPVQNPKHAVAVLVAGTPMNATGQAIPLFREVMNVLAS